MPHSEPDLLESLDTASSGRHQGWRLQAPATGLGGEDELWQVQSTEIPLV